MNGRGLAVGLLFALACQAARANELRILSNQYDGSAGKATVVISPRTSLGALANLERGAFSVTVDGKNVPNFELTRTKAARPPVSLVLAVDVSGSMAGRMDNVRAGVSWIIDRLDVNDEVAIVTFDHESRTLTDFKLPRATARKRVDALKATQTPGTVLYNAIKRSSDVAQSGTKPTKAIVVLTDGGDVGSALTLDNVVDIVGRHKNDTKLYAIGVGTSPAKKGLTQLALMSDGAYFGAKSASDIERAYDAVFNQLSDQYTLTIPIPHDGASHSLVLEWRAGDEGTVRVSGPLQAGSVTSTWVLPGVVGSLLILTLGVVVGLTRRTSSSVSMESSVLVLDAGSPPRDAPPTITEVPEPIEVEPLPSPGFPVNRPTLVKGRSTTPARAWLVGVEGRDSGRSYDLRGNESVIGRVDDATVRLDDEDVSRRHAKIVRDASGRYSIVDMASTNGVFLNGNRISTATIGDGDRLGIGRTTFVFKSIDTEENQNA